jgi:hypothetical protein
VPRDIDIPETLVTTGAMTSSIPIQQTRSPFHPPAVMTNQPPPKPQRGNSATAATLPRIGETNSFEDFTEENLTEPPIGH